MKRFTDADFWLTFSARLYRSLIFFLPKEFRQNYAAEMTQVFRDCCRDAYRRSGFTGILGELASGTFDLMFNAMKERIMTPAGGDERGLLLLLITAALAIAAGLFAAFADLRNDDVQASVLLVLIFSFALGAMRPRSFWLSALLTGLMLPTIQFVARSKGWEVKYPTDAWTPFWSFLVLIPALIGAGSGAIFRLIINYVWNR